MPEFFPVFVALGKPGDDALGYEQPTTMGTKPQISRTATLVRIMYIMLNLISG